MIRDEAVRKENWDGSAWVVVAEEAVEVVISEVDGVPVPLIEPEVLVDSLCDAVGKVTIWVVVSVTVPVELE